MPVATYRAPGNITFQGGSQIFPITGSWFFNPTSSEERSDSVVTHVAYAFTLDYNGGASVDLGDVVVRLDSPSGLAATIYDQADGLGNDRDDNQDSDAEEDYDIYFDGTGGESTFSDWFDGRRLAGDWEFRVVNGTGETLTLRDLQIDITFTNPTRPDLMVRDIEITGLMEVGETITIEAEIWNNSAVDYTDGADVITVEYLVNGAVVDTDTLTLGLPAGNTWTERTTLTVTQTGPMEVEVRVRGTTAEESTSNNSRTEYLAQEHNGQKTLANSAEEVRLAGFMVHTVYGDLRLPEGYNGSNSDNGLDDNYRAFLAQNGLTLLDDGDLEGYFTDPDDWRFQGGGLYEGRSSFISEWESQGLLARETLSNGDTALVYAFRGTDDEDNAVWSGQAWTGNGLYDHYAGHRPLIEAMIAYANDPANSIEAVIVAGHSLGGAMLDIFTAVDAQRLKSSIDLTTVSIASAGVDPDAIDDPTGITKEFDEEFDRNVVIDLPGELFRFETPDHHIGMSHSEDRVTYEYINPTGSGGYAPSFTLAENLHYPGIIPLTLINIGNANRTGDLGFGAEHDAGLYWASIDALTDDPLVGQYSGHAIRLGRTDYDAVDDLAGGDLGVFPTEAIGGPGDLIVGTLGRDWLLGLDGEDTLMASGGDDLLSGGAGNDYLNGGSGNDIMAGGLGDDFYILGSAGDRIVGEIGYAQGGGIDTARVYFSGYVQDENIELVRIASETSEYHFHATGNDAPGTLVGTAGNNILNGRGGNDQINGNAGNDTLIGGVGRDVLVGGAGADVFVYSSVSESRAGSASRDIVNGLTHGVDRIDLSGVDAVQTSFGDDAFTFIGAARFSGTAGEMRTQSLGGPNAVLLEMDVTGDGVANMQIFVNLTTFMQESDFIL